MVRNPLVSLMQHFYTKVAHDELRKSSKKIEFVLPEPQTMENPDYIPTEDLVHSLAGTVQMGAVGFDTFAYGSGSKTARGLYDAKGQTEVYNYDGHARISAAVLVWEELDFNDSLATLANSLYEAYTNQLSRDFDEVEWLSAVPLIEKIIESFFKVKRYDFEYKHITLEGIRGMFNELNKTSSYYRDCEILIEFITKNRAYTGYTANSDFNDLTQDIHHTRDDETNLCGIYFHTGCDIRCGFSSPVFGILSEGYLDVSAMSVWIELDEFGKDYQGKSLNEFLRENGEDAPSDGQGSYDTYELVENGWITIELNENDKVGNYYTDREIVLTEKAKEFIKRHNPRQKKLDQYLKEK